MVVASISTKTVAPEFVWKGKDSGPHLHGFCLQNHCNGGFRVFLLRAEERIPGATSGLFRRATPLKRWLPRPECFCPRGEERTAPVTAA